MHPFKKNIYKTFLEKIFVYVTQIKVTVDSTTTTNVVLNYTLKNGGETSQSLTYIPDAGIQAKTIQINACVLEGSVFVSPEVISVEITYNNSMSC